MFTSPIRACWASSWPRLSASLARTTTCRRQICISTPRCQEKPIPSCITATDKKVSVDDFSAKPEDSPASTIDAAGLTRNTERPRRYFTESEDATIIREVAKGTKWADIDALLGRSRVSCAASKRWSRYLRHRQEAAGLSRRIGKPRGSGPHAFTNMTPDQVNDHIMERVHAGERFREISMSLGCSQSLVVRRYNAVCPPHLRSSGRTHRPWTELDEQHIMRRFVEGASSAQISLELHRTPSALSQFICKSPSLRSLRCTTPKAFTPAEDQAILTLRAEGLTWSAIASRLGSRSAESVPGRHRRLSCHLLPTTKARWTPSEDDEALRLYEQAHSVVQIATILGRHYGTVRERLRKALIRLGRDPLELQSHSPRQKPVNAAKAGVPHSSAAEAMMITLDAENTAPREG